ncbi:hypothetical protein L3X37_05175 [Sabulilitoribacter arenilitoris]|uniref:Uncharacterized protein n=1 Tax=Wocania arenilitoris TaxID=2044858 RepID=A0AAE3JL36_9FLAO|nr:hypothetical protein [Wocania arenilitoris]MCF7567757.1 hypothetical protein [Wocania arenilitoris]
MKTQFLKLFLFTLTFSLTSCNQENTLSEYKYADKGLVLSCENVNSKLYSEALFAFENDILNYYKKNNTNSSLLQAYSQFLRNAVYGKLKFEDIVSPHTVKVFEALKKEDNLWVANNPQSYLNYKSPLVKCIGINMQNKDLKTTFNALIGINNMSPRLFGTPLMSNYRDLLKDKYLAAYVALDLYYAKLFNKDLSKPNIEKPAEKVDFNKIPQ